MDFRLIQKEDTQYGQPFDVTMKVLNNSKQARTVNVTLTATVVYYTGVAVRKIKGEKFTVEAPANAGTVESLSKQDTVVSLLVTTLNRGHPP